MKAIPPVGEIAIALVTQFAGEAIAGRAKGTEAQVGKATADG